MLDKLSSLFGSVSEPVVAAVDGKIIYRNAVAKHYHSFAKAELSELVPELALNSKTDSFITETVLDDEKYTVSGTVFEDISVYVFRTMGSTEKMQENDIIASVSLSLREPLSTMNLAVSHLLPFVEKNGDDTMFEYAAIMQRGMFSIIRALNRLDALMFLAGGTPGGSERAYIDLVKVAGEVIHSVSQLLELDKNRLRLVAETDEARVLGDRRLIERMLLCLIGNSLIFTQNEAEIKVTVKMADDKALISVSDNGGGISDDARFDVWSRYSAWRDFEDTRRGAGFGLSVVQAIARSHGGGALMESQKGKGTTVIVSLAASPDENIIPVFDTPEGYSTANDMREIFAELVNIIPKDKFTVKYMD